MKKTISILVIAILLLATVAVAIPGSPEKYGTSKKYVKTTGSFFNQLFGKSVAGVTGAQTVSLPTSVVQVDLDPAKDIFSIDLLTGAIFTDWTTVQQGVNFGVSSSRNRILVMRAASSTVLVESLTSRTDWNVGFSQLQEANCISAQYGRVSPTADMYYNYLSSNGMPLPDSGAKAICLRVGETYGKIGFDEANKLKILFFKPACTYSYSGGFVGGNCATCSDTDEQDAFVKGTVTHNGIYWDYNEGYSTFGYATRQVSDYCEISGFAPGPVSSCGPGCVVNEQYCSGSPSGRNRTTYKVCPDGCANGACIQLFPPCDAPGAGEGCTPVCRESNGLITAANFLSRFEYSSLHSPYLDQYVTDASVLSTYSGRKQVIVRDVPSAVCSTSSVLQKNKCTGLFIDSEGDRTLGVSQYGQGISFTNCPNGCSNGACNTAPPCTPQSQSCTVGVGACARSGTQTKSCTNGVLDFNWGACSATAGNPTAEICGNGVDEDCDGNDISCIKCDQPGAGPSCARACFDSDPQEDPFIRGITNFKVWSSSRQTVETVPGYQDVCLNGNELVQQTCVQRQAGDDPGVTAPSSCPNGCSNGVCVQISSLDAQLTPTHYSVLNWGVVGSLTERINAKNTGVESWSSPAFVLQATMRDPSGNAIWTGSSSLSGTVSTGNTVDIQVSVPRPSVLSPQTKVDIEYQMAKNGVSFGGKTFTAWTVDPLPPACTTQSQACTTGVGACAVSGTQTKACTNGVLDFNWGACVAPPPFSPSPYPSAEICGNGVDEDCNGADLACPPPCTDSDATPAFPQGSPFVQGTVTERNSNTNVVLSTLQDSCVKTNNGKLVRNCNGGKCGVRERFCQQGVATFKDIDCSENRCTNGACRQPPQQTAPSLTTAPTSAPQPQPASQPAAPASTVPPFQPPSCTPQSQSCTAGVGACARTGTQTKACTNGVLASSFGSCSAIAGTPSAEVCGNGVDEDCNGQDLACPPAAPLVTFSIGGVQLPCTLRTVAGKDVCESLSPVNIRGGSATRVSALLSPQGLARWNRVKVSIAPQPPLHRNIVDWVNSGKLKTSLTCSSLRVNSPDCWMTVPGVVSGTPRPEFSAHWKVELQKV